jgi:hypothetical protein
MKNMPRKQTMSAVRKGESPQKTEVLVGALMPKASVPIEPRFNGETTV